MSVSDAIRGAAEKLGKAVAERQQAVGRHALERAFADPDLDKRRSVAQGLAAQLAPLEARLSPARWAAIQAALAAAAESGSATSLVQEMDAAEAELKAAKA